MAEQKKICGSCRFYSPLLFTGECDLTGGKKKATDSCNGSRDNWESLSEYLARLERNRDRASQASDQDEIYGFVGDIPFPGAI